MLTDTEVADVARQALEDELAGLNPPDDLLAHVRARHAGTVKMRRTATAAVAAVTASGLAAGILAGTVATAPRPSPATAARGAPGTASTGQQTIVLDGFTIKIAAPLRLADPHPAAAARGVRNTARGRPVPLVTRATFNGSPVALLLMLASGKFSAAATVRLGHRVAYVVRTGTRLSLYVPFQTAVQVRYLVLSAPGLSESQLVKLAQSITIAGQPGYLRSLPSLPSSRPAMHCPCG
jgi:hypothetical protein